MATVHVAGRRRTFILGARVQFSVDRGRYSTPAAVASIVASIVQAALTTWRLVANVGQRANRVFALLPIRNALWVVAQPFQAQQPEGDLDAFSLRLKPLVSGGVLALAFFILANTTSRTWIGWNRFGFLVPLGARVVLPGPWMLNPSLGAGAILPGPGPCRVVRRQHQPRRAAPSRGGPPTTRHPGGSRGTPGTPSDGKLIHRRRPRVKPPPQPPRLFSNMFKKDLRHIPFK